MSEAVPEFDSPDLAARVTQMDADSVHRLPFGAIRLDRQGQVVFFSRREAEQSGFGARPALGLHFFTTIAPCMDQEGIRQAVERAVETGDFDLEFDHVGDFDDRSRQIRVRALPDGAGGVWLFTQRG